MPLRKSGVYDMDYRERIINRINRVQDMGVLQYLDRFLELFLKEWGGIGYAAGDTEQ